MHLVTRSGVSAPLPSDSELDRAEEPLDDRPPTLEPGGSVGEHEQELLPFHVQENELPRGGRLDSGGASADPPMVPFQPNDRVHRWGLDRELRSPNAADRHPSGRRNDFDTMKRREVAKEVGRPGDELRLV